MTITFSFCSSFEKIIWDRFVFLLNGEIVIVLAYIASYEGSAFIEMLNKLSSLTMPHVMDDRFATWWSVGNDKNSNQEDIDIFLHAVFLFIETLNFLDYLLPPH